MNYFYSEDQRDMNIMNNSFRNLPSSTALRRFKPIELLSQNDIAQSWVAENLDNGTISFLKIANLDSKLENGSQQDMLLRSFLLQRRIRSAGIILAANKYASKDLVIIEYPYYPPQEWAPLSEGRFWRDFPESLIQVTQLVDYLHLINLIHGDIKLDNFLVHNKTGQIKLSDLEFLKEPGTPLKALIVGAPEHIAPEIYQDLPATTLSDNFAVGILVRQCLKKSNQHPESEKVARLSELLTINESYRRPAIILDALKDTEIIDTEQFERLNRQLFYQQIVSAFDRLRKDVFTDTKKAQEFFPVHNRTVGLARELVEEIYALAQKSKATAFAAGGELIDSSPLIRRNDYWQIEYDREALNTFYRNYFPEYFGKTIDSFETDPAKALKTALAMAEKSEKEGKNIKAFTLLQFAYHKAVDITISTEVSKELLLSLCRLSEKLNRASDVIVFGTKALHLYDQPDADYYSLALTLIMHNLMTGNIDSATDLIDTMLTTCGGDNSFYPEFMRLRAWIHGIKAEYKPALEILDALIDQCEKSGSPTVLGKLYNNLGTIYLRMGDYSAAEKHYQMAISIGHKHDVIMEMVPAVANLASLYCDTANYTDSIKLCKEALRLADQSQDKSKAFASRLTISRCYSRLDNFAKAMYFANEHLADSENNITNIGLTLVSNAGKSLNAGQLAGVPQLLYKGLSLIDFRGFKSTYGTAHFLMSEWLFYTGDFEKALAECEKGLTIFQQLDDKAAVIETKMLEAIIRLYYRGEFDIKALGESISASYRHRGIYFSYWGLFLAASKLKKDIFQYIDENMIAGIESFSESQVAVFKSMYLLHRLYMEELPSAQQANDLKEIFRILNSTGKYYLACRVCEEIADLYADNRQLRLASKYLDQGIKIAERLSNRPLIDALTARRDTLSDTNLIWEERIDILYNISEVLTDVTDYSNALIKILTFAVNEAGAERGALLLRSGDSDFLQVKAYINCDNQSLTDISQLSRSIPELAALNGNPLIIGNALQDDRTMHFKSVVLHNIQSVLCVPIAYNKRILGVLYLDHYTIPALFSESDISFVIALTNFIGLLITLAQKYSVIQITNDQLLSDLKFAGANQPFITKDQSLLNQFEQLPDIACTNVSVLITGESGTGKEILCHMLHTMSQRADKPLTKLNCAAIASTLLEAELFGIEKGVATGVGRRIGKFAAADTGTLFLDEIGDMPLNMQAKVLRAIEYQKFEMVGSHRTITTDIRFICATNKNLPKLIEEGKFREDLFYRINAITIELPPLRKRRDDILPLINHFAGIFMPKGKSINISQDAIKAFLEYSWPGNVRELKNVIERLCIVRGSQQIRVTDLPREFMDRPAMEINSDEIAEQIEAELFAKTMKQCKGNQSKAAKALNLPLSTFRRKMKKYGIKK